MELPFFNYNYLQELKGENKDLEIIQDERWLGNSVVGYLVEPIREEWAISLVFVSAETPLKFVIRKLEKHTSAEKAYHYGVLAQKTAKMLHTCYNQWIN
ncbi:hypothetical protein [Flectobacillus major]|uniref:hypothetical protein n=1 Tax=Flectobacillus major TaxID=103 RepID=UPI0003F657BC|nr:hypothetical protein [Flectobacillus major]